MSTTTRNSAPALDSLSPDEDQQKAIDELFSQMGQNSPLGERSPPTTSVAMPATDPLAQLPRPRTKREPLPLHVESPSRRQCAVPATYEASDEPTWWDRLRQVTFIVCLALAAILLLKTSWFDSVNDATASRKSTTVNSAGAAAETKLQTIPIEKVQVGT